MGCVEGLHADAVLVCDLEEDHSRTEQPSIVLRENTQSHTTTQGAAGFPCDGAGVTHFPFAHLLHLQPSPLLSGTVPRPCSCVSVREVGSTLSPSPQKCKPEVMLHSSKQKLTNFTPWIF